MKHLNLSQLTPDPITLVWLIRTQSTSIQGGDVLVEFDPDGSPRFSDEWGTRWNPGPLWQIRDLKLDVRHAGDLVRVEHRNFGFHVTDLDLDTAVMKLSIMLDVPDWVPCTMLRVPESETELEEMLT